jgi:hypothetical protein
MTSFERGLIGRLATLSSSLALSALAAGCQQQGAQPGAESPQVAVVQQAATGLAEQCGLTCPSDGIAKGNASISGVVSIDAFFQSVLDFQTKALNVSGGIDAQIAAIKADFGLAADGDLKAAIAANVEGGLQIDAEPAKCEVDAHATLEAQAHCDASIDPGKATVKCSGSCEVDASADVSCSADADLECTATAPSIECSGTCSGTCEVDISGMAACSGECHGDCSGDCSAYVKDGSGAAKCSGKCDGMCKGSCEAAVEASGKCSGKCEGSCKTTPGGAKCEGSAHASCKAKANAMAECKGRCDGDIEPPKAKAECEASAKAEAKVNVECTPPRVAISYKLKAGLDAMAQAKFTAAIKNLEVRLPALLASMKKAGIVVKAGTGLIADAGASVKAGVQAQIDAKPDAKSLIGLGCAVLELPNVGAALETSSKKLAASVKASAELTTALGMKEPQS